MDQHRFFNACMSLMNLDMHELVEAGIIAPGNVNDGGSSWKRFNDEPLVFLAKIDDQKRDALWKLLEARQRLPSRLERAIALLGDSLTAWEGEEDSVKEEHADLIAELSAFLDGQPDQKPAPKVRYALSPSHPADRASLPKALYDLGDVRLAWVNEGDLYLAGEEVR